jgi:general secretion pathway protein G
MRAKSGFTLVEILIVVVILGILAAIVIPQFTEASTEAKESRMVSDLQTMRSQIELYKIQHNDELPGSECAGKPMGGTGNATFVQAMTSYTDVDGNVQTAPGVNVYGPYIQKIPTNPWNDLDTVGIDGTLGDDSSGWEFNTTTGAFYADDSKTCADGTAHSAL